MSSIPPSSSDYQKRVTYDKTGATQATTSGQPVDKGTKTQDTSAISYISRDDGTTSLGDKIPTMDAPDGTVTTEDQITGLNDMADQVGKTPQMELTLYQADALTNITTRQDPNVTAALMGAVLDKAGSKDFAQALEDALADPNNFNADGTPTEGLQDVLDGGGMGRLGMLDNLPDAAKQALKDGDAATDESKAALEQYLNDCLDKGFGGGKLSPMFALMLLLTQYSNMRSMMDERLQMVRQQFIKAGYDKQITEMTTKAITAAITAGVTALVTVGSLAVQVKGLRENPVADDKEVTKLNGEKEALEGEIEQLKEAVKDSKKDIQIKEISDDIRTDSNVKYFDEAKITEDMKNDGVKPAPSDICDEEGNLDLGKLIKQENDRQVANLDVDAANKEIRAQEETLGDLEYRADMKQHSIDERTSVLLSKQNTKNQIINTTVDGLIKIITSGSQYLQSMNDVRIKGFEYEVTEDTFYQRQLSTNQQQSDQSMSSLRQSAAQIEESTSGTLSGIGRSMV